jgi:hypothetical protein
MQSTSSTNPPARRWLILALGLIVLSTLFFVTGVAIERGIAAASPVNVQQGGQAGGTTSTDPDGGHDEHHESSPEQSNVRSETVLGLDLENPVFIGSYVLVWLGLAVALLLLGRLAWMAVLSGALVATVLDVAEVIRQLSETRLLVASFAMLVALAHVTLIGLAILVLMQNRRGKSVSVS